MRYRREVAFALLVGVGIVFGWGSYLLYPWQMAIVTPFTGSHHLVTQTGWHWHWPLLESVQILDRRRQVLLSPPVSWPSSGQPSALAHFLVLWQIHDPKRYATRLSGSLASARSAILTELKSTLQASGPLGQTGLAPSPFPALPVVRLTPLNADLSQDGIRIIRIHCASLQWPARRMARLDAHQARKWHLALAQLKRTARLELARIQAHFEKQRMSDRLQQTVRVDRIVAEGLSRVADIEAPARRMDPRFYDFLVRYENDREVMKKRIADRRAVVPKSQTDTMAQPPSAPGQK